MLFQFKYMLCWNDTLSLEHEHVFAETIIKRKTIAIAIGDKAACVP